MLLSLVKESEFEAILNGPLSLTLGEKLSTDILFSILHSPLTFQLVWTVLFKASEFYQRLLNILLYSVVLFLPVEKDQLTFLVFLCLMLYCFPLVFSPDTPMQMLWLLLLAQDICFSVGPSLFFIPSFNLYVPLLT